MCTVWAVRTLASFFFFVFFFCFFSASSSVRFAWLHGLQVGVGCSLHTCAGDCWSGTCTLVLETVGLVRADVWFTHLSEGERVGVSGRRVG